MSFLSGLGKGLHRAFDGNNLAIAQALLAGDYQSAGTLRARQEELQRQQASRDAQVIAAKDLGIGGDVSAALTRDDLSALARRRAAARMFGPQGEAGDEPPAPEDMLMQFAPSPGRFPAGPAVTETSGRYPGGPGLGGGTFPAGPPRLGPIPPLANIARAQSYAQAAALPQGSFFFAPDASLRRIA